jgi:hypothetical protein
MSFIDNLLNKNENLKSNRRNVIFILKKLYLINVDLDNSKKRSNS